MRQIFRDDSFYRIFSLLSNRYLYLKPRCTEKNPSNRDIYVCAMRANRIIFNYTISVCGKRLINVKNRSFQTKQISTPYFAVTSRIRDSLNANLLQNLAFRRTISSCDST